MKHQGEIELKPNWAKLDLAVESDMVLNVNFRSLRLKKHQVNGSVIQKTKEHQTINQKKCVLITRSIQDFT